MPYVTRADLTARYTEALLRELTDRTSPYADAIVDAVLDQAIASADGVIDGYLSGRYSLPLAVVPSLLTDIAARLVLAALHIVTVPEKIMRDQQDAMRCLRDIASGAVTLDVGGAPVPAAAPVGIVVTASPALYGRDNLKVW